LAQFKLKELPRQLDFESLFGPQKDYVFFENAADHPFRPQSTHFQIVNAWWMAEFSLLAYLCKEEIARRLQNASFTLQAFPDKGGSQCLIASNDRFIVVAFRGTEVSDIRDLVTDAKLLLVPAKPKGTGKVHRGFQKALDNLWPEIKRTLERIQSQQERPVWFTGHSLGGALATLAAHRFTGIQGVYTFGSPRVGNPEFAAAFEEAHYRFVNNNDLVTMVPPEGLYEHVGSVRYIDKEGNIHDSPHSWRVLQDQFEGHCRHFANVLLAWQSGEFKAIPSDNLNDHAPIYYAVRTWNSYVLEVSEQG
jgi:triacylglycerol lipase